MLGKLRTWWRLPWATRALVIEAGAALLVGAALCWVPLRWYAAWLGRQGHETPASAAPPEQARAREVGWAIRLVAKRVPFRGDCLPQAIAARAMLGRRRLAVTVYFGTAFLKDGTGLEAHTWARSGAATLTGNKPRRRFAIVATFGHEPG